MRSWSHAWCVAGSPRSTTRIARGAGFDSRSLQKAAADDEVNWGTHKGSKFKDVPANYIKWLRTIDKPLPGMERLIAYDDQKQKKLQQALTPTARTLPPRPAAASAAVAAPVAPVAKPVRKRAARTMPPVAPAVPVAPAAAAARAPQVPTPTSRTGSVESLYGARVATSKTTAQDFLPNLALTGLNADVYEVPSGLMDDRELWSCKGMEWGKDDGIPSVWDDFKSGWSYVSKVVLGRSLVVSRVDSEQKCGPPTGRDDCNKISEADITVEQYAKFIGAILEEESRRKMRQPLVIEHAGKCLEALPNFRFRGVEIDGKPHIAALVDQELYANPDMHLGGKGKVAMASMIGLKVRPVGPAQPWFTGLVVCDPPDPGNVTLTLKMKHDLLAMTKTREVKEATERAALDELILTVSKNCTSASAKKLDFVANALRPSLTGAQQEEKLRRVKGWETWRPAPPSKLLLVPARRQALIDDEISRLSKELRLASTPSRMPPGSIHFQTLPKPMLHFGRGSTRTASDQGNLILSDLNIHGAFHAGGKKSPAVRIGALSFGKADGEEEIAMRAVIKLVAEQLKGFGFKIKTTATAVVPTQGKGSEAVAAALRETGLRADDVVLLFGTRSLFREQEKLYDQAKWECLRIGSGENTRRHLSSQWFDLSKVKLWREDTSSFRAAVQICAVGLLAKLGHAPWAIDANTWFRPAPSGGAKSSVEVVVAGYDVCHLPDPKAAGKFVHVAAGIRVESRDHTRLLSRISYQLERVGAETVPLGSIRRLIPPDFACGKVVIVHRDGEYPHEELRSLATYQRELAEGCGEGAADTTFVLVECVKWAGKSPRLYNGGNSAQPGEMMALSSKNVLLASSKNLIQGTANPINVRLARVVGELPSDFDLKGFAWVRSVLDLSYMHHGSVLKAPRLPVTTHFADRLAYMIANVGEQWDKEFASTSSGFQQFWL